MQARPRPEARDARRREARVVWWLTLATAVVCAAAGVGCVVWQRRRKQAGKPAFGWARRIGAAAMFTLAVLLTIGLVFFPPHGALPPTGPFSVAVAIAEFEGDAPDPYREDRPRQLSAEIYYPDGDSVRAAGHALLVFSHGGMGFANQNVSLFQELASHGYVVISVDHAGQSLWTKIDGQLVFIDNGYMRDLMSEDASEDRARSFELYTQWMQIRMSDLDIVIDSAKDRAELGTPIYHLIDTSRIVIAGHSLGGAGALGIGRTRDDIAAVVALESPFMYDITGVHGGEFVWRSDPYPVPVMNLYTDSSYGHLAEWPQYAQNQQLLTSEDLATINVYLEGCGHYSITDLTFASPLLTRFLNGFPAATPGENCLTLVNTETLQFLNTHLDR